MLWNGLLSEYNIHIVIVLGQHMPAEDYDLCQTPNAVATISTILTYWYYDMKLLQTCI